MEARMPALGLMIALLVTPTSESRLAAQTKAPAGSIHACDLLSNAEVEKVTGRPSSKPPSRLSDAGSTQSYCGFRDAAVRVTLFSKMSAAEKHVYQELEVGGFDKAKHAVAGVGDSAAIYFTAKGKDPAGFMVIHAGARTLTIGVRGDQGKPAESAQPFAVGLAKIALAKLD
jgi:hypothetical protein